MGVTRRGVGDIHPCHTSRCQSTAFTGYSRMKRVKAQRAATAVTNRSARGRGEGGSSGLNGHLPGQEPEALLQPRQWGSADQAHTHPIPHTCQHLCSGSPSHTAFPGQEGESQTQLNQLCSLGGGCTSAGGKRLAQSALSWHEEQRQTGLPRGQQQSLQAQLGNTGGRTAPPPSTRCLPLPAPCRASPARGTYSSCSRAAGRASPWRRPRPRPGTGSWR